MLRLTSNTSADFVRVGIAADYLGVAMVYAQGVSVSRDTSKVCDICGMQFVSERGRGETCSCASDLKRDFRAIDVALKPVSNWF